MILSIRSICNPLLFISLFILIVLVYWPGVSGGFIFDDFPVLVSNVQVQIDSFSIVNVWQAAFSFEPGGGGRQLAMASFAVNHALHGLDPWGYKLAGLLVHAVNALLIFALTLRLLYFAGISQSPRVWAAFAISLLWAVHPLQVSSVLYVVQRMETMSLTFVLLAMLTYITGRKRQINGVRGWPWIAFCVPLVMLGLASKETAVLFVVYVLMLELTLLRFAAKNELTAAVWRWVYGIGSLLAIVIYLFVVVPHFSSLETHTGRNFNTPERLFSQLRILVLYLGQILLPLPNNLSFYYDDFLISKNFWEPITTLLCGLLLLFLMISAWFVRKNAPLYTLGIYWFFTAHLLTSNVIALELVFEHRNYFALFGVVLAIAELVRRLPVRDGPGIKYFAVTVLVVGVGTLGVIRAAVWGDKLLLATDLAAKNPNSARAAHELGVIYYEMSDGYPSSPFYDFAWREFERESAIPHSSILAEQSLILMMAASGRKSDDTVWRRLLEKLRSNPITPETTSAMFELLKNRFDGVELNDESLLVAFQIFFSKVGMPFYSYAQVGKFALRYTNDEEAAADFFMKSIEAARHSPEYLVTMFADIKNEGHADLAQALENYAVERNVIDK